MASSTLIQNLSGTGVVSNRRQTETFLAGAAIVTADIGKIAMIDITKTGSDQLLYVRVAAAVALGNQKACGVDGQAIANVAANTCRPFGVVLTTGTSPECWIYPQF